MACGKLDKYKNEWKFHIPNTLRASASRKSFFLFFYLIFAAGQMRRSSLVPQATEENRRSLMLFAIVVVFLICHTPRTFLNLYEVWNAKRIMLDIKNHCLGIPLSILFTQQASHLLLAINSSVNFFLYCAMSPLFLQQLSEYFTQSVNSFYQCCCAVYMKGMLLFSMYYYNYIVIIDICVYIMFKN